MGNLPAKITGKYQSYDINTPVKITPPIMITKHKEELVQSANSSVLYRNKDASFNSEKENQRSGSSIGFVPSNNDENFFYQKHTQELNNKRIEQLPAYYLTRNENPFEKEELSVLDKQQYDTTEIEFQHNEREVVERYDKEEKKNEEVIENTKRIEMDNAELPLETSRSESPEPMNPSYDKLESDEMEEEEKEENKSFIENSIKENGILLLFNY